MTNQDTWRTNHAGPFAASANSATFHFGQCQDAGVRTSLADIAFEAPGTASPETHDSVAWRKAKGKALN